MTDVNIAPPQHPVGRTPQNDFREQSVSEAAEHATWEKSMSDRTPPRPTSRGVAPGSDASAFITISGVTGAALDGTHALSDPIRLLADDPTRRSAQIVSFSTANCYLAHAPGDFQGFAARVAVSGLNAVPMPGMIYLQNNQFVMPGTREVWLMFIALAALPVWCSVMIDRATRQQP